MRSLNEKPIPCKFHAWRNKSSSLLFLSCQGHFLRISLLCNLNFQNIYSYLCKNNQAWWIFCMEKVGLIWIEIGMRDFVWISFSVFLHSTKWMDKRSCWKYQSVIKAVKPQIKKSSKGINVSTEAKCSTASLCTPFPGIYTAAILHMEKDVGKISGALYPKTWESGENGQINLWGKGGVMSCSKSVFSSK